jgi:outer membrane protein assembly factor BamB
MRRNLLGGLAVLLLLVSAPTGWAADWPQLQKDAARTGRTTDTVAPPYRARWIWLGPSLTLRNRASDPAWPDNLVTSTSASYSYPMPASVAFTIAESVQPVLASGRLFIGTLEGDAYGIDANDGSTLWTLPITGGTWSSAAVSESGSTVIFVTLSGNVYGAAPATGGVRWTYDCRRSLTAAPCVSGNNVYVADHGGTVTALAADTGAVVWTRPLPAPVLGGLAADATSVYVGAENLIVYALNVSDGQVRAQHQVRGQSFRMLWPVVFNNRVWVSTVMTPLIGSEYIMEQLMTDSTSFAAEESNIALWLQGLGGWADAGSDWRHVFALNTSDLSEPFTILAGPADGCGTPTAPVVVDNSDRVLTYFKTRYPTFTAANPIFGTNYSVDIAAIDQTTGHRLRIDNGHTSGLWPWETDNLFGLSVGGTQLWMRQNFRGTQMADLNTSTGYKVEAQVRNWDGGDFSGYDIIYLDQPPPPDTAQREIAGRVAPILCAPRVYIAETYGITAIEHRP